MSIYKQHIGIYQGKIVSPQNRTLTPDEHVAEQEGDLLFVNQEGSHVFNLFVYRGFTVIYIILAIAFPG